MTLPFVLPVFLTFWCITLFMVLPVRRWGRRRKLLYNTLFAALAVLALHLLLLSGLVPLRQVY